jgi:TolB protein
MQIMSKNSVVAFLALWFGLAPLAARAVVTIEITQGTETAMPIAVVPFDWQPDKSRPGAGTRPPYVVSDIVEADLARSGRIQVLSRKGYPASPHDDRDVVFKDWRLIKAEALVIGQVRAVGAGQFQVQFRLYDVFKEQQLAGYSYTVSADLLRTVAHQIADIIYERLTGEPGAFNTRVAYVTKEDARPPRKPVYRLQVADSDGFAPKSHVTSSEPLMSPAWSADGKRLAYVSFEQQRAYVYVQNVLDGRRELVAEFRGINSAPAWSPDGRKLALTLSRDGNPEVYTLDLTTRELKRLTYNAAIDTEPTWSPDGRHIAFTSDRSGGPQIYRMPGNGGQPERLTFEGDYNARASYSPDGKMLVLVSGYRGKYNIATLRLDNKVLQVLTDTALDESPSFAPNGRMVLYATAVRGRGVLTVVTTEGRGRQQFRFDEGDIREPAWSPYNRDLQTITPAGGKGASQ